MSDSRLEKFIYAICSMDVSDLPVPLSRIEKLWNCLITGETPDFEPLSRNEKYLMAMLDRYDISNLPAPMSRGEKLLYKIAVGETDLSDVPDYLSRYEELLKYLIENGGISEGDFEYVLYTLNQSLYTLYTTAEKPVKSAILKGSTKYRDIDTGEILEAFEEGRNLELVSVKMPVLKTIGKNLIDASQWCDIRVVDGEKRLYGKGWFAHDTTIKIKLAHTIKQGTTVYVKGVGVIGNNTPRIGFYNSATGMDSKTYLSLNGTVQTKQISNIDVDSIFVDFATTSDEGYVVYDSLIISLEPISSYEPFKSNILTVNEEVELRGIGDVRDELDLLSGEVTQYIGEIVLDGSEDEAWNTWVTDSDSIVWTLPKSFANLINPICDRYVIYSTVHGKTEEMFAVNSNNVRHIQLRLFKTTARNINELKIYLQSNPITVQYKLESPTIKTVDLTVVDQDNQPTQLGIFENVTHVALVAENLIPEVEMEVATHISEELASASPLMDDISTEQQQLNTMVDEQSENVDATMIATTEIYEETL